MAIRFRNDASQRIGQALRAFFEPHSTTDANFDAFCQWLPGTTRALLNGERPPTAYELLEICVRLHEPPGLYIQVLADDGSSKPPPRSFEHCTPTDPCCPNRFHYRYRGDGTSKFTCPRDCLCHT